jgi:small conductance mechanosensitive channel
MNDAGYMSIPTMASAVWQWFQTEVMIYFGVMCWVAAILILGVWAAMHVRKRMNQLLAARGVEPTIRGFLAQVAFVGLLVLVAVLALSRMGVQMASVVAVIASVSFALVLALQGSLAHVASGIVLVVTRPFKVGDYIEVAGVAGTVQSIDIMFTQLLTSDCRALTVPNSKILSDAIVNCSSESARRVELPFCISYDSSIETARQAILEAIRDMAAVQSEPAEPTVWVKSLDDSGMTLILRYWTAPNQLPLVSYQIYEAVKLAFDQKGIIIPYPTREIRMSASGSMTLNAASTIKGSKES